MQTGTTFGETATYSCDTGFTLIGDTTRTCQATGLWSGNAPTCQRMLQFFWKLEEHCVTQSLFLSTVVDCGTLSDPANGQVSHPSGTTSGQIATYSCDPGYNLTGESTRMCQVNRTWSGIAPTCQRKL